MERVHKRNPSLLKIRNGVIPDDQGAERGFLSEPRYLVFPVGRTAPGHGRFVGCLVETATHAQSKQTQQGECDGLFKNLFHVEWIKK